MLDKEHKNYYKGNKVYENFLTRVPFDLYNKYIHFLEDTRKKIKILDVGCGVGTVANSLSSNNLIQSYGVDISDNFIRRAKKGKGKFAVFDGSLLPFESGYFDKVGCFTVLEHVENPYEILDEMCRVLKKNGKIIIGGPSFLRVFGFSATHHKTAGYKNSIRNLFLVLIKYYLSLFKPETLKLEFMRPVVNKKFNADDDAICVTNMIEIRSYLKLKGFEITYQSGLVNFSSSRIVNFISHIPILRDMTGGYFIVGTKK